MSNYTVRPATQGDAQAIAEIHVTTWQSAYEGIIPDEDLAGIQIDKRLALWKEAIEYGEPQVHVVVDEDEDECIVTGQKIAESEKFVIDDKDLISCQKATEE